MPGETRRLLAVDIAVEPGAPRDDRLPAIGVENTWSAPLLLRGAVLAVEVGLAGVDASGPVVGTAHAVCADGLAWSTPGVASPTVGLVALCWPGNEPESRPSKEASTSAESHNGGLTGVADVWTPRCWLGDESPGLPAGLTGACPGNAPDTMPRMLSSSCDWDCDWVWLAAVAGPGGELVAQRGCSSSFMFAFSPANDPDTIPRMLSLSWVPLWLGAAGLTAVSRGVPGRTDALPDADGLPLSFCRARDSAAMRRSARWLDILAWG